MQGVLHVVRNLEFDDVLWEIPDGWKYSRHNLPINFSFGTKCVPCGTKHFAADIVV